MNMEALGMGGGAHLLLKGRSLRQQGAGLQMEKQTSLTLGLAEALLAVVCAATQAGHASSVPKAGSTGGGTCRLEARWPP